jgi:cytochrome c oxidase subunit II
MGDLMLKYFFFSALYLALVYPIAPVGQAGAGNAAPRRVEVVAKRYTFDPPELTLTKGVPVVLVLKSADVPHGVRVRELNVELKAPKGGESEVQFTPEVTGNFVGHCSVFCGKGHGSMTLVIHVNG